MQWGASLGVLWEDKAQWVDQCGAGYIYSIVQGPLRNRVLILQSRQGAKSNNEDKASSGDSSRRWARQTWMFVLL